MGVINEVRVFYVNLMFLRREIKVCYIPNYLMVCR